MGINIERKKIIMKGYANKNDVRKFCKVGSASADKIYQEIVNDLQKRGKVANRLGIDPTELINYMGLTEKRIFQYAEEERKEEELR